MDKELIRHIIVDKKEEYTDNPEIKESDIVYIKDTKEIFTHGGHYGGPSVKEDTFNVEEIIIEDADEATEVYSKEQANKTFSTKEELTIAKQEVKDEIIGSAPKTYDTLQEIAEYIEEHKSVETALNQAIAQKANDSDVKDLASQLNTALQTIQTLNAKVTTLESFNKVKVLTSAEYQNLINTNAIDESVVYITEDDETAATLELTEPELVMPTIQLPINNKEV